jgi:hypothetical protein
MSQVSPTPITTLPAAPSTASPSNFSTLADAFLGALATFVSQVNAIGTNVYNNAVDCYNNAVAALASQTAAAASASAASATTGVLVWVSGTTYAIGNNVFSPINYQTYRRKTTGAGSTDPSSDATNWQIISALPITWARKTTTYSVNSWEHIQADTTSAAWSMTFPASPAAGDEIEIQDATGNFSTNNLTLLTNGNKIMGFTTSFVMNVNYAHLVFVYNATSGDWRY